MTISYKNERALKKATAILRAQIALTPFVSEPTEVDRLYNILSKLFEAGSKSPPPPPRPYKKLFRNLTP